MAAVATSSAISFILVLELTSSTITTIDEATDWMMKYLIILSLFHLFFLVFSIIVNLKLLTSIEIHVEIHLFLEIMMIGDVTIPVLNAGMRLIF